MAEYMTEQKKILTDFLHRHCDTSFTADELVEAMKNDPELREAAIPGRSTVYRLITRLVEEGTVKRFSREKSRSFAYQIIKDDHCHNHLHLKCVGCGKLIHMDEELSEELLCRINSSSNFKIDEDVTVLYGKCTHCLVEGQTK